MASMSCRESFCLVLSFVCLHVVCGFFGGDKSYRRKVSLELNPGLNDSLAPPTGVNLLHARAQGQNDTLHFLFCSQGAPALVLIHTDSPSSEVQVDWPRFLSGDFSASVRVRPEGSVRHGSALVFTRLWEYNDVNDTADPEHMPPSSFFPPYELESFTWRDLNSTLNSTARTVRLCGGDNSSSFHNGSFCLQFSAFESDGRPSSWPCLLHNANSSQLQFGLEGVTGRSNRSRFSLELQLVGREGLMSHVDTLRSIDDEYTPSIFQMSQWVLSPDNVSTPILGYVQWKPVAYRNESPVFSDATPCRHSKPSALTQLPPSGLVLACLNSTYHTTGLNVTFSIKGDPFYNETNYLSWTMLVGLGSPPTESFSGLVLTIMALGLGIPLVLILVGGVWVCIRRQRRQPEAYEPIN